jgi:hypothetical protein
LNCFHAGTFAAAPIHDGFFGSATRPLRGPAFRGSNFPAASVGVSPAAFVLLAISALSEDAAPIANDSGGAAMLDKLPWQGRLASEE